MKNYFFSKKILLPAVFTLLFLPDMLAQYSFSPTTTLIKNQVLNTMTYDSIHIANNSGSALILDWELISLDTNSNCFFDFCAAGNCYIGIPDTGSFPDIAPGQFGWIGMHFFTGNVPITSTAKVRVFEQGGSSKGDTLTFIINAAATNGINNHTAADNSVSVYPNPVSDVLRIHASSGILLNSHVSLYCVSGKELINIFIQSDFIDLDISSLAKGVYFLNINTKQGITVKKVVIF